MEFRSSREIQLWNKIVREISGITLDEGDPIAALERKATLIASAVGMMTDTSSKTTSLREAASKLKSDIAKARSGKAKDIARATKVVEAFEERLAKIDVSVGKVALSSNSYWAKRLSEGKGRSDRLDTSREMKVLKAQLLEVLQEEGAGADVSKLKKDLVGAIKVLETKNIKEYKKIAELLEDEIPSEFSRRFDGIRDLVQSEADESKQARKELIKAVANTVGSATMGILDRLGVGGLNVGNALRLSSSLLRLTAKGTMGAGRLVGGAIGGMYRWNKVRSAIKHTEALPGDIELQKEERKSGERKEFLSLFRKQVDFMKDLVKSKDERDGESFLGRFASMVGGLFSMLGGGAAGLLGGKLTWAGLKTLLLSLGKMSGSLLTGLGAGLFGLFGAAAKAGGGVLAWLGRMAVRFLPFILKRALVFIPVVGVLLAGILWGKDIYDAVQQFVMPYIQPMLDRMAEWLKGTMQWAKDKFSEVVSKVKAFVEPVQTAITSVVTSIGDFLDSPLKHMKELFNWLGEKAKGLPFIGDVLRNLPGMIEQGRSMVGKATSAVAPMISGAIGAVGNAVSAGGEAVSSLVDKGKALAGDVKDTITSKMSSAYNATTSAFASGYDAVKGAVKGLFSVAPTARLEGVNPEVQQRFANMISEYRARGGNKSVVITSGYRTMEEQADLYSKYGPGRAAPPGTSMHERGFAIDASSAALNEMNNMGLLSKYGLARPVPGEPWHVQPAGISRSAANAGIFSADAASHQGGVTPRANVLPQTESVKPGGPFKEGYGPSGVTPMTPGGTGDRANVSQKVSVNGVPTFSYNDGSFFAANLGVLAG